MQKPIITLLCAAGMIISTSAAIAENLRIKPDAPARYTVKQGDTLWGIAGKYLYRPWKWHALWGANRHQIANPNLIYPGQTLVLNYINGQPHLGVDMSQSAGIPTIKLRPRVHDLGSGYGIPSINVNFYSVFMKTPQFMSDEQLSQAARLVGGTDSRLYFAQGDRVYADGIKEPGTYMVFRINRDLQDPVTKANLGKLVELAGEVETLATPNSALAHRSPEAQAALAGDEYYVKKGYQKTVVRTAQPMMVLGNLSEIHAGDYLIKRPEHVSQFYFMPHEPEVDVRADVVDIMEGVEESGTMQTLILNKGSADGLDEGTVLGIYRRGIILKSPYKQVKDGRKNPTQYVNTPNQEIGLAMVYRTGEHVSSVIILESVQNVSRSDIFAAPGQDLDAFSEQTK